MRRFLKAVAIVLGLLTYVWFAAVRHAPHVRSRKAARRTLRHQ